jgi:hypothetical protein
VQWNGVWVFWCIWCRGPVKDVGQIYVNDVPTPYLGGRYLPTVVGDDPQIYLPVLNGAMTRWMAQKLRLLETNPSVRFTETLPGIAHSAVVVDFAAVDSPPNINCIITGKKVFDPRSVHQDLATPSTWEYSRNAALCLADFLRSTEYGASMTVDDNSLIDAANFCDDTGRYVDLLIDKKARLSDWIATLSTAANCWLDPNGTSVKLLPDEDRTSSAVFRHADGTVLNVGSEQTEVRANLPTVVEIVYTDTSPENTSTPAWKDASVQIERAGVTDGTTPWRKSSIRMPWIQDEAQARREAYLRMNKLWLRTPTFQIDLMDEALAPEVGDAISLTYPDSGYIALLKVKIVDATPTESGWRYSVFYDDPGAYVDDRIADPTPPTDEPNPFDVPPVDNLAAVEVADAPRLHVTWDAPANYPYTGAYPFYVVQDAAGSPLDTYRGNNIPPRTDFTTTDLTTNSWYLVTVWNRNVFGMLSVPRTVRVFLDAAIYTAVRYAFRTPTLVNMAELVEWSSGNLFWVTEMGDLWDATFPTALDGFTNPLQTYHTPGTSTLTTEEYDALAVYTGLWAGTTTTVDISGTSTQYIELRTLVSDAWTRHAGATYTGSGERVRLSSEATGTGTQRVNALGEITVTLDR